ncbi:transglycosylase SLT domain-containing protein [Pannus brasiliensis CCIBt3594]|uniref:Transglycosylase SLT domain-containing protein n=1 Tax=Pannus brasiliensis CCIBt3594 TaxID=1427578 RepID=A0AAW9QSM8_9CHRO
MPNKLTGKTTLALGLGSGVALAAISGVLLLNPRFIDWIDRNTPLSLTSAAPLQEDPNQPSQVVGVESLSQNERDVKLKTIADENAPSLDRSRARYLLAADLLRKYEGGPALRQLEGLEKQYPLLAPQILLKRGRAYELTNDNESAQKVWKELIATYPTSPVVADALYALGKSDPSYYDKLLTDYPRHPKTLALIRERLKENPDQFPLWLQLAKANPFDPTLNQARDRLVKDYADQLTPADWASIGAGYWQSGLYEKAYKAYAKATPSPEQAYRYARSLQIQKKTAEARAAYQKLIKTYPKAEETGLGLLRLARLSTGGDAIGYLDRAVQQFPDVAPRALQQKAQLLEKTNPAAANQAWQTLLTKYPKSDEAAEYRWDMARKAMKAGNTVKAWEWARPIATNNPDSPEAPKASFWIGKWAQKMGKQKEANDAFLYTIARFPHSYYAWRSAVALGWDVGDFTDVRSHNPTTVKPDTRIAPPAGSEAFKELYRLGEDTDAWNLFQAEIADPWNLTIEEQFNLGLYKLALNQNLEGINLIWRLRERDTPEEQQQWKALRDSDKYWHALFPFPYYETILQWSKERRLNPLLVTSLIRQESRFEKEIRSPVGAVGLMQIMPDTGKYIAGNTGTKSYSLTDPEDNIMMGTWYLDYTHDKYGGNSLFAVASYNAGPGAVSRWKERFSFSDPDEFVENIPYDETKGYVESVFGNYWNYLQIYNPELQQQLAKVPKPS